MRLIDADKGLISKIQRETGCNFITAQKIVDSMPTAEEHKGKWEYKQLGFRAYGIVCTNCGYVIHQGYDFTSMEEFKDMVERELQNPHITVDKYCCKCGAEMRGNTKRKGKPIEGNNESYNCENWIP